MIKNDVFSIGQNHSFDGLRRVEVRNLKLGRELELIHTNICAKF